MNIAELQPIKEIDIPARLYSGDVYRVKCLRTQGRETKGVRFILFGKRNAVYFLVSDKGEDVLKCVNGNPEYETTPFDNYLYRDYRNHHKGQDRLAMNSVFTGTRWLSCEQGCGINEVVVPGEPVDTDEAVNLLLNFMGIDANTSLGQEIYHQGIRKRDWIAMHQDIEDDGMLEVYRYYVSSSRLWKAAKETFG